MQALGITAVRAMQKLVSLPWGHGFNLNKGSPEPFFLDLTFDDVGNLSCSKTSTSLAQEHSKIFSPKFTGRVYVCA